MTKDAARKKAELYLKWAQSAEDKSNAIYSRFQAQYGQFDWTQPILRGHYSQRRHEKVFETRDRVMRTSIDLDKKAKLYRSRAANLLRFANTNKGDASRLIMERRAIADTRYGVGSPIFDPCFREGVIEKVNKVSYTIRFAAGHTTKRDKSFFGRD